MKKESHHPDPDHASPGKPVKDDIDLQAILEAHADYLFTPDPDEPSAEEIDEQVRRAMEATVSLRKRPEKPGIWKRSWIVPLALAASLVIVAGLWMGTGDPDRVPAAWRNLPGNTLGIIPVKAATGLVFRDATITPRALYDESSPPLAFLIRESGPLRLERPLQEATLIQTRCIALAAGDEISLAGRSPAVLLFPGSIIRLSSPGSYAIKGDSQVVDLRSGRELAGLETGLPQDLLSPMRLLERPDTRRESPLVLTDAPVVLLSPAGMTLAQTPEIVWIGMEEEVLELNVTFSGDLPDDAITERFGPVRVQGGSVTWADTGWPALPRSSKGRLDLRNDERVLASAHFSILSSEDARGLDEEIGTLRTLLPKGDALDFAKALLLLNHETGCVAEARLIAARLRRQPGGQDNIIYMRLLQHAYAGMGMQRAADQIEQMITRQVEEFIAGE